MNNYFKNITANSISTIWAIIFQLLSVPVFLSCWGATKYGEWIVLNSFVVFFQMSDIGINTASLNSFVINFQKGNLEQCKKIFINSLVVISLIFTVVLVVLLCFFKFPFYEKIFKFNYIKDDLLIQCLLLLFFYTYLGTIINALSSIYSATGNYSRGIMLDNISKFTEGITLILLVYFNISLELILTAYLVLRFLFLVIKYLDSKKLYKIDFNVKYFSFLELKNIIIPSLAFFTIPISNTFIFQGFTLIVNYYFGPTSVVLYSTTRTLINMIKSLSDIIVKSIWPHISFAFAKNDFKFVRLYHSRILMYSLIIFSTSTIFILLFSKTIYLHWTRGKSEFDIVLVCLLLVAMLGNLIQSSSSIILQATNQHSKYVIQYLFFNLIGLLTAFLIARYVHILSFIPLGLIVPEFLLSLFVIKKTLFLTKDSINFLKKRLRIDYKYHYSLIKAKF